MYKNRVLLISLITITLLSASLAQAALPTVEELTQKIKETQGAIKTMRADLTTTITSTVKDVKKIVQKGRMWTKAPDKSKIEILSPTRQITITDGTKMAVINPDTGQKFIQDLAKLQEKEEAPSPPSGPMDSSRYFDYFDLSIKEHGKDMYLLRGVPKEKSVFQGKMDFYIDKKRFIPVRICLYNEKGAMISLSEIEYKNISGVWVPYKNTSMVSLPTGSMNMELVFSNIKVNEGIPDKEFKIE